MAEPDWMQVCLAARELDAAEGAALDDRLAEHPDHLEARVRRIGFATRTGLARGEDIVWLVIHRPDVQLGGFAHVDLTDDPAAHAAVGAAWDAHLRERPDDPVILRRAADFFDSEEPDKAEDLLRQGAALEPSSSEWLEQLGRLRMSRAREAEDDASRAKHAALALEHLERALRLSAKASARSGLLIEIAEAARVAGESARARDAATELLRHATSTPATWSTGDAIHRAHVVLGKLALAASDVRAAIEELQLSARTPGSPVLRSYGPDLDLARQLLRLGEREAVAEYLVACGSFWESGGDDLTRWLDELRSSGTSRLAPDWGVEDEGNLDG